MCVYVILKSHKVCFLNEDHVLMSKCNRNKIRYSLAGDHEGLLLVRAKLI